MLTLASCEVQKAGSDAVQPEFEFIRVSKEYPRYFENSDGKTWIPVTINYIIPNGRDSDVFRDVKKYFKHFSANGGNSIRIWISSPFLEIEDQKVGVYDSVKFARIDSVISLAREYGLHIKFTLQHIRTIQSVARPGFGWANRAFMSEEQGGPFKGIKEYVNTPQGRTAYLDRVRALANRYRNTKVIFGWELWNEMDAVNADWYDFTAEMLDSVHELFPNQLVLQSLGSMFNPAGIRNYKQLLTLDNNDYICMHRYLDMGAKFGQLPIVRAPIDSLVVEAMDSVYVPEVVKPVVFDEIGATAPDFTGPSALYEKDTAGVLAHDMIFAPFFCGAAGCGSMWYWNDYVEKNNLWYHYRRFQHMISGVDPVAEHFTPFSFCKDSVRCYGLKGMHTTMIWCRDATNNWESELVGNIIPKERTDFSFPEKVAGKRDFNKAKIYDPWKDSWEEAHIGRGQVEVPAFTRSVVVVLQ